MDFVIAFWSAPCSKMVSKKREAVIPTMPTGNLRGCLHGGRKILELGRSQRADHPSAICFLYSVYMQVVVLGPSSRIFLVLGSSQLTTRKILALGRSQHFRNCLRSEVPGARDKKKQTWRRPGFYGIQLPKVDSFVWRCHRTILMILMTADNIQDKFCFKDTPPKRETEWKVTSNRSTTTSEYIRITCLLFSPAILLSFSTSTQTEISACKPNEKLFRLLGFSQCQDLATPM